MSTRRQFIRNSAIVTGGALAFSAKSYARILGANDRVRVGVVGFSDRFKNSLLPPFAAFSKEMNFEIVALSDIWNLRRDAGKTHLNEKLGADIQVFENNEALYDARVADAESMPLLSI